MSTLSARLGLKILGTADNWSTADYAANLNILDGAPGITLCLSSGRPVGWGAGHEGMVIYETDHELYWRWSGTEFQRLFPKGLLGLTERTSNFATSSTSPVDAITCQVEVPYFTVGSTAKRIKVTAGWYALDHGTASTGGICEATIRRDPSDVALMAPRLHPGRPQTATDVFTWGGGGTMVAYDDPPQGTTTYRFCVNSLAAVGLTTTLRASATTKAFLMVEEVAV